MHNGVTGKRFMRLEGRMELSFWGNKFQSRIPGNRNQNVGDGERGKEGGEEGGKNGGSSELNLSHACFV